jgi:hypothetical protein
MPSTLSLALHVDCRAKQPSPAEPMRVERSQLGHGLDVDEEDPSSTSRSRSTVESTSYVAVNLDVRGQRRRQTVDVHTTCSLNRGFPLTSFDTFLAFRSGGSCTAGSEWGGHRVDLPRGKARHEIFRGIKPVRRRAYKHASDVIKQTKVRG